MDPVTALPKLYAIAWLVPLASFALIVLFGPRMGKAGSKAGWLATGAILTSCALSLFALFFVWLPHYKLAPGRAQRGSCQRFARRRRRHRRATRTPKSPRSTGTPRAMPRPMNMLPVSTRLPTASPASSRSPATGTRWASSVR